jgi:hypothetical protein
MSKQVKKLVRVLERNAKQREFYAAKQKRKTFNAGRGTGKSYAIGDNNYKKFRGMPQGHNLLVSNTYYQLLTKTTNQMEQALADWGIREYDPKTKDGHWVFGKKPPFGWKKPHSKVRAYEYCYSFINGYYIELASMETKEKIRGGSVDGIDVDESATIQEEDWKTIVLPCARGINHGPKNIDSELRYSICDYTSAPWTLQGKWIYKVEELAKQFPKDYFFLKAQTSDNIKILGEDYLKMLKQNLSPLEYFIEVLNGQLQRQADGGFYPSFNESKHCRTDTWEYDWNSDGRMTVKRDSFIHEMQHFILSFDFNVRFTSLLVCQEINLTNHRELRFCDALFERPDPLKDEASESIMLIDRLVESFCKKYAYHPVKYIELDGDGSAKNLRVGATPMFEQVAANFRKYGWQPIIKAQAKLPFHQTRYLLINNILRQSDPRYPRIVINGNTCKPLILSIQNAPVKGDFQKNKGSELKDIDQTLATHFSDCFDYVILRLYGNLISNSSSTIWASTISKTLGR